MRKKHIIIIGGGPAGLTAAIASLRKGAKITLLEHQEKSGKKLLVTGRGRCNLSNHALNPKMYFGKDPNFVRDGLNLFGLKQTLDFLESIGIKTFKDLSGKYFPYSEQSSAVLECLRMEIHALGGIEKNQCNIRSIEKKDSEFNIILKTDKVLQSDALIIATGGKSFPELGSDGSGYTLAETLGHTLIPPQPALVQICSPDPSLKALQGYKLIGKASLNDGKKIFGSHNGEILFTNYGFSGIPILQLSRQVPSILKRKRSLVLTLDLLPRLELEQIEKEILFRQNHFPKRNLETSLIGFLHKRLIPVLIRKSGLSEISTGKENAHTLARQLKSWSFPVTGTLGWENAQVTSGGIHTREVNPITMESKITPNLHFAGEILDVDGLSGGYNLQWAWTSGYLAGSAAGEIND